MDEPESGRLLREALRLYRAEHGLTMTALGARLGFTRSYLYYLFRGDRQMTWPVARSIAEAIPELEEQARTYLRDDAVRRGLIRRQELNGLSLGALA